jgi:hypothetical protein
LGMGVWWWWYEDGRSIGLFVIWLVLLGTLEDGKYGRTRESWILCRRRDCNALLAVWLVDVSRHRGFHIHGRCKLISPEDRQGDGCGHIYYNAVLAADPPVRSG